MRSMLLVVVLFLLFAEFTPVAGNGIQIGEKGIHVEYGGWIKNLGEKPIPINKTDLLEYDYPLNTSDQKVVDVEALVNNTRYNYTVKYSDGSATLIISAPRIENSLLKPGEKISSWVKYNVIVDMYKRVSAISDLIGKSYDTLAIKAGGWNEIHVKDGKYLNSTRMWNISNPLIKLLYKYITSRPGVNDKPFTALMGIVKWIDDNIVYSTRIPARQPWEVIVEGAGDCDDQSNLLITLLRAAGIPSYLEIGLVYIGPNFKYHDSQVNGLFIYNFIGGGGHGWVTAYIPPWGWLRVDLTASIGRGLEHITGAAYYLTPIIVTNRVYGGDYASQGERFAKKIQEIRLQYNITLILREYNP
jgi:hypothetical protein